MGQGSRGQDGGRGCPVVVCPPPALPDGPAAILRSSSYHQAPASPPKRRRWGSRRASACPALLLQLVLLVAWAQGGWGLTRSFCLSLRSSTTWPAMAFSSVTSSSCLFYVQLDSANTCADFCQSLLLNTTMTDASVDCSGVATPPSAGTCAAVPTITTSLCADSSQYSYCCLCAAVTPSPTRAPTNRPVRPTRAPTKPPTRAPTRRPTRSPTQAPTISVPLVFSASVQQSLSCLSLEPSLLGQLWGLWLITGIVAVSWAVELLLAYRKRVGVGGNNSRIHQLDNKRQREAEAAVRQRVARVQSGSLYLGLPAQPHEPLALLNPLALAKPLPPPSSRPSAALVSSPSPHAALTANAGSPAITAPAAAGGAEAEGEGPEGASSSCSCAGVQPSLRGYWWRDLTFHLLNSSDLLSLCLTSAPPSPLTCWDRRACFLVVSSGLLLLAHLLPLPLASSLSSTAMASLAWRCGLACLIAHVLRRLCRQCFPCPPPLLSLSLSRLILSRDLQRQLAGNQRVRVASPLVLLVACCCPWLNSPALLLSALSVLLLLASYTVSAYQTASITHGCLQPWQWAAALHDASLTFLLMGTSASLSALLADLLAFFPAQHSQRCLVLGWCVWDFGRWRLDLLLSLLADEEDKNLKTKVRRLMRRYRFKKKLTSRGRRRRYHHVHRAGGGLMGVEDPADYLRLGLPARKWVHLVLADFPLLTLHSYDVPRDWHAVLRECPEVLSIANDDEAAQAEKEEAEAPPEDYEQEEEEVSEEEKERERRRQARKQKRAEGGGHKHKHKHKHKHHKEGDDDKAEAALQSDVDSGDDDDKGRLKRGEGSAAAAEGGAQPGQQQPVVWVSTSAPLPGGPTAVAGGGKAAGGGGRSSGVAAVVPHPSMDGDDDDDEPQYYVEEAEEESDDREEEEDEEEEAPKRRLPSARGGRGGSRAAGGGRGGRGSSSRGPPPSNKGRPAPAARRPAPPPRQDTELDEESLDFEDEDA